MSRILGLLFVVVLVFASAVGLGTGPVAAQDAATGGEITIGLDFEPDNLDPHVTPYAVSHTVMMNIFDPLIWRDNEGEFQPGLAESWEASEDGTQFTFHLRDGVTFHVYFDFVGNGNGLFADAAHSSWRFTKRCR